MLDFLLLHLGCRTILMLHSLTSCTNSVFHFLMLHYLMLLFLALHYFIVALSMLHFLVWHCLTLHYLLFHHLLFSFVKVALFNVKFLTSQVACFPLYLK